VVSALSLGREAGYDRRTLRARPGIGATLVLTALTVTALTACGGAEGQRSAATSASTARDGSPAPTVGGETGERPPGGPAPPELRGTWFATYLGGPARLYIREDGYAISAGGSGQGDFVVDGPIIAFFNSNGSSCPPDPLDDVGRYRWKISNAKLRLRLVGKDPCGGRVSVLTSGPFERVG
jgi:hypothetical protein